MKNKTVLGRAALFGATLFWGTSFVILKNALDSVPTLWILAVRFSIAALLLALVAGKRLKTMGRASFVGSVLIGLCLAAAYIFQTYGLKYTTPGKNAFLTATYCVLTPFFAWMAYKRRPGFANVLAAFLCIIGIGLVSLNGDGRGINPGDLLTLVCGAFYAIQIILMERYVGDCDALSVSTVEFATAALVCWVGTALFETAPGPLSPSLWLSILYMAVICTALCFFLQAWGIQYTPASTAAVILTFEAVFGALCSLLFYHEELSLKMLAGFVLIFLSILLSETSPHFLHKRKSA